ncbi:hypothetical protein P7C70_g2756, partial [Phenoliferia sp. Uapishka_3]
MWEDNPPRPSSRTTKPIDPLHSSLRSPTGSYTQPAGASSRRGRPRSNTIGTDSFPTTPTKSNGGSEAYGKKRQVFCDVIYETDQMKQDAEGEFKLPEPIERFALSIGTKIELPETKAPREFTPPTPSKPPRVDIRKAADFLHELCKGERSCYTKSEITWRASSSVGEGLSTGILLTLCLQVFAKPLFTYAKQSDTVIIRKDEADLLFGNLQEILPILRNFATDLEDLWQEYEDNPYQIPPRLGQVILANVQKMEPFRAFLANTPRSQAVQKRLLSNTHFQQFIQNNIAIARDEGNFTSSFQQLLAEPFQRIQRYHMMIDPIRLHLPQTDESVAYLDKARRLLHDICLMEDDGKVEAAAVMWSLDRTIADFPASLIRSHRRFITCIDVDEKYETSEGSTNTLRCTLFLLTDKLLIVKRPSGEKGGRQIAGLDNMKNLVLLYEDSFPGASMPGTPRKLKRNQMDFRGAVDLVDVSPVDLGGPDFGLLLEHPPTDQGERWAGRPARRYTVASTYPSDVRRSEKEVFITQLAERRCLWSEQNGCGLARKSARMWDAGGATDSVVIYYNMWERAAWEADVHGRRGKLALHLDGYGGKARDLIYGGSRIPRVIARADFLDQDQCRFSVRPTDGNTGGTSDVIGTARIPLAIDDIASTYGIFDIPRTTPRTPGGSVRSRPRSGIFSQALDVFGSAGLRREHSMTSKASSATTTSRMSVSGVSSGSCSPQPYRHSMGSMSPGPYSASGSRSVDRGARSLNNSMTSEAGDGGADMEVLKTFRASSASPGMFLAPPDARSARRRSMSLPAPPAAQLLSPDQQPRVARVPVPTLEPAPMDSLDDNSPTPQPSPSRASSRQGRRLMGPRQLGEPSRAVPSPQAEAPTYIPPMDFYRSDSPPLDPYQPFTAATVPYSPPTHERSPAPSPFARDHSPS